MWLARRRHRKGPASFTHTKATGVPRAAPNPRAAPWPSVEKGPAMHRALVVDDERTVTEVVERYLLREGFDVAVARDGPGCVDRAYGYFRCSSKRPERWTTTG